MNNFPFEYKGQTLWYSRSVACSMYLFVKERNTGNWYILVSKRGPGCPSAVGMWNVPGGYLDFNESLEDCAIRECYEETGVRLSEDVKLASITSNLKTKKQNVVCSFFAVKEVTDIFDINTTTKNCEKDEVDDVKFIRVEEFDDENRKWSKNMAFGQDQMIREIFNKRINIGPMSKHFIDMVGKLTKLNVNVE